MQGLTSNTMQHREKKLTSVPMRLSSRIAGRQSVFAARRDDLHYMVCNHIQAVNVHSRPSRTVDSSIG